MTTMAKRPELEFANIFMARLDNSNITRQSDHVKDPRTYQANGPTLLPSLSNTTPPPRPVPSSLTTATTTPTILITLTALKPPPGISPQRHHLPPLPLTTSILDLKAHLSSLVSTETIHIPVADGLRVLYKRKPVADSKILSEIIVGWTNANDGNVRDGDGDGDGDGKNAALLEQGLDMSFMVLKQEPVVVSVSSGGGEKENKRKMGQDGGDDDEPTIDDPSGFDVDMKDAAVNVVETDEFWTDLHGFLLQRLKNEGEASEILATFRGAMNKR